MENLEHNGLFMMVLGGKPEGRFTEQHDIFFGIAERLAELLPYMLDFWPEIGNRMHIDSYRKVSHVGGFDIEIVGKEFATDNGGKKLFFVNLGGYKPNDMEEYHYKQLVVADNLAEATKAAKESVFWKHHESSHIDDKYGIDVDDIYEVTDLLSPKFKEKYQIKITMNQEGQEDPLEVGYLKISKLEKDLQQD